MDAADLKRRLAAILAGDAVGYARLMSLDESATVRALDAARAIFQAQIAAHQGRVIDMAGDSVLAIFETATGAIHAAVDIQRAIDHAAADVAPDQHMRFRIGVHLGEVIEKTDGSIYGDGVNVAARLQSLAPPGAITLSEAVHGVVRGKVDAQYADLGQHRLKNIARPLHVYAILANGSDWAAAPNADADADADRAGRTEPTAAKLRKARPKQRDATLFVGRRQEMAGLKAALASARGGRGQLVVLAGSGGIGKTRLAQQLATLAESEAVPVLWGRCLEEPGAPPYWPWRQLIRSYLRSGGDTEPAHTFGTALADIAGIVPELAEHLDVPRAGAENQDTAQSRFQLFDAVVGFWRRAAHRAPLLLVFEDLHWADTTSLRLLAFLASELEDCGLMVLGTYRDTELSRQHPLFDTLAELARSPVFQRLELTGLSGQETEEFMAAATGHPASANFVSMIHLRTEGHPLFLEETLRFISEGGASQPGSTPGGEPQLLQRIPTGVREVIGKRLNRLSVSAVRLLSTAACIGRTFDLDILARLEADKSEDEVLLALEEALAGHLIEAVPQTGHFRFSHALIRETLYDEMLALRRARLHLRIGELLEQQHGDADDVVLPQLAYHFSQAGPGPASGKALGYARRSAARAAKVLAFEEAVRQYRLALHLQQRHFPNDAAPRCSLLLSLGEVELSAGSGEPARAVYEEAATLARREGLVTVFAQAAAGFERSTMLAAQSGEPAVLLLSEAIALHLDEDPLRVELLARLCRAYVYCDRAREATEAHARAVALARKIGDANGLYIALASIVSANYWPGMLHQRLEAANEAWDIAERRTFAMPVVDLLPYFMADLMHVGDMAALRRVLNQGLRLSDASRSPYIQTLCRHTHALLAINEGRFVDAESWATQALQSGRRIAEDQALSAYGMQMFCLRREQGRLREALPMLQHFVATTAEAQRWQPGLALLYAELDMQAECRTQFDSLPWQQVTVAPSDASTLTIFLYAAETCVYLEDAERAATLYPLLKGNAGTILMSDFGGPCLGSADRLLGNLATVMQRWDLAQGHFESALDMDGSSGARVWLAHSRFAFARMLHRRASAGDAARASELLAQALAESSALGMNALTPRITALAQAISTPPAAYPCGLTEREVDVIRLIAMGRNNREIAQVLAISPNTVANHVRNILDKTYTANRTEAAAFANREGLVAQ